MNAFVKKEVRLLLPNLGFAAVLALAGLFFPNHPDNFLNSLTYFLSCIICPAVAAMLALSSFGVEVSAGTFPNLLAQPVSRLKIWETKIALLAVALLAVAFLWLISFFYSAFYSGQDHGIKDWLDLFSIVSVTGLVIFSGGLWTVLLLRQVAAAFWFMLLVPGVLLAIVVALFGGESDAQTTAMSVSILGLYSLAGLFFARWLFLRAQDLQWSGGNIEMPELRGLARFKSAGAVRMWRPRAALWRKEFLLHQSQYVMAFVLAVLHLGVLGVRRFYDFGNSRDLKFALEIFWGLWFVMPLLVGCAAVAEERKIGTLEGQLCLPVKRRTQFAIKFFVMLFLSVLLGVVVPLLLEGKRILPGGGLDFSTATSVMGNMSMTYYPLSVSENFLLNSLGIVLLYLPLLALVGIALLIGGMAFYASSLARNTLQSLAPAVLGILVMCFLLAAAAAPIAREVEFLWSGPLAYFIGVPLVLLTLVGLAFWNFQQVKASAQMGWRNLLAFVLAVVLGVLTTAAVYHRAWEKLTPFEPAHGAARLALADFVRLENQWNDLSVRMPDGKIWKAWFKYNWTDPLDVLMGNFKVAKPEGSFIEGANWKATVTGLWFQQAGIKSDGTLWVSPKPARLSEAEKNGLSLPKREALTQFGSETNWSSLVSLRTSVLLVKNDGTLWRWGVTNFDSKHETWPGLQAFTPQRFGTESNWAEVSQLNYRFQLRKTDGIVWNWNYFGGTNNVAQLEIEPGFIVVSMSSFKNFRSTANINHGLSYRAGVRDDGTFRVWSGERAIYNKISRYNSYERVPMDLQIGNETNWLAVAGDGEKVVTLKNDGTLWLWNFHRSQFSGGEQNEFESEIQKTVPVRLSTHADWVAISGNWGAATALAADGSIWYWPLEMGDRYSNDYDDRNDFGRIRPLLESSRKPQLLGNVLDASNR
jgi:ABC-type transport system involved in multi-copper enzyme maturation permease subunit